MMRRAPDTFGIGNENRSDYWKIDSRLEVNY
jgi:hypothetical protein